MTAHINEDGKEQTVLEHVINVSDILGIFI